MRKLKLEELGRDSVESYQKQSKLPIVIVLDNVRSGHNVGSVFRTCDAFGFEQMVLCGITPRPPHKEINKTAIGATLSVDWKYFVHIKEAIIQLKEEGYTIFGIEQTDESQLLHSTVFAKHAKSALVFGNEVSGLSEEILPLIDHAIEIQQFGTKHSFNVAVCAGIVMWEVNKALRYL